MVRRLGRLGFPILKRTGYTFRGGNSDKITCNLLKKGVYCKREESAPKRSKFFPLQYTDFSEEVWCTGAY